MALERHATNDQPVEAPKPAAGHLLPEELHKPSNFKWPTVAGNGEQFVPHLPIYDGGKLLTGGAPAHDGRQASATQMRAGATEFAAHPQDTAKHEGAVDKGDNIAPWTVKKGETLYGKAEQMLHSPGDGHSHPSSQDIRKEVVANAERNNWVKGADAATSPEEKHRRSQFEAYLKDGKTSHLPKDLNGMVHKSMKDSAEPAPAAAPKPEGKDTHAGTTTPKPEGKDTPSAAAAPKPDGKDTPSGAAAPKSDGKDTPSGAAAPKPDGKEPPLPENLLAGPVTDLSGRPCKQQPKGEQFQTLENKGGNGCTVRDPADPKHPENKELGDLVKQGKESTVGIHIRDNHGGGGAGTGVIIGRSDDGSKVYVATDNHVASPEVNHRGMQATSRRVLMPDGKVYDASLALKEPQTDRAVLSVDVGKGNAEKFKVAQFADNPAETGKGVVLGFPKESGSIYASPANLNGIKPADYVFGGPGKLLKGEQPNRPTLDMPKTRTEEGVSGGPIYNSRGQVAGLLEGGQFINPMTGNREYWSYGNPTSKADVENWLAKIKANQASGK